MELYDITLSLFMFISASGVWSVDTTWVDGYAIFWTHITLSHERNGLHCFDNSSCNG